LVVFVTTNLLVATSQRRYAIKQAYFARRKLALSAVEGDLGEPEVSRFLRHINRAFGSLPCQTAPLPAFKETLK
jgi:hypothetical protein